MNLIHPDPMPWKSLITVEKWLPDKPVDLAPPDEIEVVEGNLLLLEGANVLLDRLTDSTPTYGVFDNSNAVIGIGTSTTAATSSQTDLQATNDSSNRYYKGMEASYPTPNPPTAGYVDFKVSLTSLLANFAWNEFVIAKGTAGAGGTGSATDVLNRRVQALGTKQSGSTWNLTWRVGFF